MSRLNAYRTQLIYLRQRLIKGRRLFLDTTWQDTFTKEEVRGSGLDAELGNVIYNQASIEVIPKVISFSNMS